jgi:hypothetical protein
LGKAKPNLVLLVFPSVEKRGPGQDHPPVTSSRVRQGGDF